MYNNQFYNIWNYNYIQQEVQRYHNNQVAQTFDCAQKLKDFLESIDRVEPQYQTQMIMECCAVLMDYAQKHGWK